MYHNEIFFDNQKNKKIQQNINPSETKSPIQLLGGGHEVPRAKLVNKEWDNSNVRKFFLPYKGKELVSTGFITNIPALLQTFRIYYIIYD